MPLPPSSPGRIDQRSASAASSSSTRVWTRPLIDDHHGRRVGRGDGGDEFALYAGEVEVGGVAGLADRGAGHETRSRPDEDDGDIGGLGRGDRGGDPGCVVAGVGAALLVGDLGVGQRGPQAGERCDVRGVVRAGLEGAARLGQLVDARAVAAHELVELLGSAPPR